MYNVFSSLSSALWFESILVPFKPCPAVPVSSQQPQKGWRAVESELRSQSLVAEIINAVMMLMKRGSVRKTVGF